MIDTSNCNTCHDTCSTCVDASDAHCSSCPTTGPNAGSFLHEGEDTGVGVCVSNTSSVVKTTLVMNGLNMSAFNSTDQIKQIIVAAVVTAVGVDATTVFVDSIGVVPESNATSSRRQLSTSAISAVIRIVTSVAQADAIGVSLEQKVSSGALLEAMATEAETLDMGDALAVTLREATVELSAPPTVTGEDGVPRPAKPETPTPSTLTEEGSGIGMLVLIIVCAVAVIGMLGAGYYKITAKPKDKLSAAGKKPVAMVVPTNDEEPAPQRRADRELESILGPPTWMGAADEDSKEEESDLPSSTHLPDLPSMLPDLPDLDTNPFAPPPPLDFSVPAALRQVVSDEEPDMYSGGPKMEDDPDDPILGPASWMKG
jgi:hypothetical protein